MLSGIVSLIGAGPGRANFLTLAAIRSLETADLVLYDALIAADIQAYFPPGAKLLYVGKRCGQHSLTQAEINERLVFFAKAGLHVVRLKGGDPFIFGPGAEEVMVLKQHRIPIRIIPAISALNGVAAAVGLPLTARTTEAIRKPELLTSRRLRLPDSFFKNNSLPNARQAIETLIEVGWEIHVEAGDHGETLKQKLKDFGACSKTPESRREGWNKPQCILIHEDLFPTMKRRIRHF